MNETTKVCEKCGTSARNSAGRCKKCLSIASSKYAAANREKINKSVAARTLKDPEKYAAINASWRAKNKEREAANKAAYRISHIDEIAKRSAIWRSENKEKAKEASANWWADNPEARKIYEHNRRSKKKLIGGVVSTGLPEKLFELQQGKCPCCQQPLGDDYHLDHIMPLALGGSNADDNMQLLRKTCNLQKRASHPVDFMQRRGFLL